MRWTPRKQGHLTLPALADTTGSGTAVLDSYAARHADPQVSHHTRETTGWTATMLAPVRVDIPTAIPDRDYDLGDHLMGDTTGAMQYSGSVAYADAVLMQFEERQTGMLSFFYFTQATVFIGDLTPANLSGQSVEVTVDRGGNVSSIKAT